MAGAIVSAALQVGISIVLTKALSDKDRHDSDQLGDILQLISRDITSKVEEVVSLGLFRQDLRELKTQLLASTDALTQYSRIPARLDLLRESEFRVRSLWASAMVLYEEMENFLYVPQPRTTAVAIALNVLRGVCAIDTIVCTAVLTREPSEGNRKLLLDRIHCYETCFRKIGSRLEHLAFAYGPRPEPRWTPEYCRTVCHMDKLHDMLIELNKIRFHIYKMRAMENPEEARQQNPEWVRDWMLKDEYDSRYSYPGLDYLSNSHAGPQIFTEWVGRNTPPIDDWQFPQGDGPGWPLPHSKTFDDLCLSRHMAAWKRSLYNLITGELDPEQEQLQFRLPQSGECKIQ